TACDWATCPWTPRMDTGRKPRRPNTRAERGAHAGVLQFPRVLSVLPVRACQPHFAAAAFHRQLGRAGAGGHRDRPRQCLVAAGGAVLRLRFRLDRAFLLREEPARDVPPPVLFLRRRLGDVRRHPARPRPPVARGAQSMKISQAATAIRANPAQWFHFSGSPRYHAENQANTSRVITSCMPLSCGAL